MDVNFYVMLCVELVEQGILDVFCWCWMFV